MERADRVIGRADLTRGDTPHNAEGMWGRIRFYLRRARELRASGQLVEGVLTRLRAGRTAARFRAEQAAGKAYREYSADLPAGYPARKITLRLSVPIRFKGPKLAFSDHAIDAQGRITRTVLALTIGGFALSRDLGKSWKLVKVEGLSAHRFIQIKDIGQGEFLVQVLPEERLSSKDWPLDLLVVNEDGKVLVRHSMHGHRWHGCRSAAIVGDTIMFAEYPSNIPVNGRRKETCRVWRSRDRGRNWQSVFEKSGDEIRHFHFLQPRPGHNGEWWLSSGDWPQESHVWVTKDDGDGWVDVSSPKLDRIGVSGRRYKRDLFRLTDLAWSDDDVFWGTDDYMGGEDPPGARIFKSAIGRRLQPELIGVGKWHFRNVIDIGAYLLFLSQRSKIADLPLGEKKPAVFLVPKKPIPGAPEIVHICDLDVYPTRDKPGFTFSKASRAALDGTFFTHRSSEDIFPAGHKILEWNVRFE